MYVYITCDLYLFLYIFLYLVCNNRPHLRICIRLKGTIPEKNVTFSIMLLKKQFNIDLRVGPCCFCECLTDLIQLQISSVSPFNFNL